MLQLFDHKYPYTDFHELNLDWIISMLIQLDHKLTNFVNINTIKYADPIAWDITRQYETNTIVIDQNTGIAYISTKPVPEGISIGNTAYWTEVFNLQQIIGNITENLTIHDNGQSPTLIFSVLEGDWILWNNKLYVAKADLIAGTALIDGINIDAASVEELTKYYTDLVRNDLIAIIGNMADLQTSDVTSIVNAINSVLSDVASTIGDLNDLTTTDKTSIVNAINEVMSGLSDLAANVGDLNDLTTTDKTSIVNAVNENVTEIQNMASKYDNLHIINVLDFGAKGDGVTDDTQPFKDAIAAVPPHGSLFIPYTGEEYLITSRLDINKPMMIYSDYTGWDIVAYNSDMSVIESRKALIYFDCASEAFYSHMSGVTFKNITIKCGASVTYGFRCDALNDLAEQECRFVYFEDCTSINLNNTGIGFSYESGILGTFLRCVSYGWIRGFSVSGNYPNNVDGVSTSISFINCWAENCTIGYFLRSAYYCALINCASDSNVAGITIGYDFLNCRGCSLIACGSERNKYGIRFTNSYDILVNMVIACTNNAQYGIRIDTGATLTFIDCQLLWWSVVTDPTAKQILSVPAARMTFIGCSGFEYVYNGTSNVNLPNQGRLDSQYTLGNFTL